MARKVRLNIVMSAELSGFINDFADAEGCTATEVIRRGLAIMKAFQQQRAIGRCHIGFVSDPSKLDSEMVGIIT